MRWAALKRAVCVWVALIWPALAWPGDFFTLKGHGGPIKGIAVSPDGSAILIASFDYALGHWQGGTPTWLEGHKAAVNAVVFVDNTRAVSSGDDFAVRLWDLTKGTSRVLGHHKGKVVALRLAPDGQSVASASWDGSVGIWPLNDDAGRLIDVGANVNDVAFSSDGATILSAASDGRILEWDVATAAPVQLFISNGFGVNTLVLNADQGWLVFGSLDGVTRVVDMATGETIRDVTLERRPILAMTQSRDGAHLAVGDGEGYILILDTRDWSIHADFRASHRGPIWALAFSSDGKNIHAGGLDDAMFSWLLADPRDAPKMVQDTRSFLNGNDSGSNGEQQFQRKCSICHTLTGDSARRAGRRSRMCLGDERDRSPATAILTGFCKAILFGARKLLMPFLIWGRMCILRAPRCPFNASKPLKTVPI
ncbi:MAG: WD40 repeat domain-containing protein [Shimia sp.]|uniref:WD40 repeat domain-containing protein n=1 Tax=Shimia sp. TaxID=1954381 RepID=UPI0040580D4F